jgi:hypothetical protein
MCDRIVVAYQPSVEVELRNNTDLIGLLDCPSVGGVDLPSGAVEAPRPATQSDMIQVPTSTTYQTLHWCGDWHELLISELTMLATIGQHGQTSIGNRLPAGPSGQMGVGLATASRHQLDVVECCWLRPILPSA